MDRLSPFAFRKAKSNRKHHRCAICEAAKHLNHVECTIHGDRIASENIEIESPPPIPSPVKSNKNLEQALLKQEQKLRDEFKRERELFQKEQDRLRELVNNMQKDFGGLKASVEMKRQDKKSVKTIEEDTTTKSEPLAADASALRDLEKRVIEKIDKCFEQNRHHEEDVYSNLNHEPKKFEYEEEEEEMMLDTDTNNLIIIVPNDQVRILSDGRSMVRVPADRAKRVVAEIVDCDLEVRRRQSLLNSRSKS